MPLIPNPTLGSSITLIKSAVPYSLDVVLAGDRRIDCLSIPCVPVIGHNQVIPSGHQFLNTTIAFLDSRQLLRLPSAGS